MTKTIIIIPTFNEIENIGKLIEAIQKLSHDFHILIVDDNSPDGTADLVVEYQTRFPKNIFLLQRSKKLGLGTAYIEGFKYAIQHEYDYIFEMDADFSHHPKDIFSLLDACKQGFDVAIGSRYVSGLNVINWPINRVLMSYFASIYVRIITGMPYYDTTAGFKCYRKEVLQTINFNTIRFVGYAFQIEMKFLAWKHGFKIKEIPIVFTDRTHGKSKMDYRIFREAIFGVIQMKMASLFKKFPPFHSV